MPPSLNNHLSLFERVEDFAVKQPVPQLSEEAFDISILSRSNMTAFPKIRRQKEVSGILAQIASFTQFPIMKR